MSDPPQPQPALPVVVARPVEHTGIIRGPSDMDMALVRPHEAALDLLVILAALIVLPYLPPLVASVAPDEALVPEVGPAVIVHKWCEAGLASLLVAYFVLRHRLRPATFGLRTDRLGRQVLWGLAALGAMYVVLLLSVAVIVPLCHLFPVLEEDAMRRVEFAQALPTESLPATIALLLAVAIHEEALFRGLLLPYVRRVLGSWWWAGLCSTLLFAALHAPEQGLLAAGVQILGIGVVLTVFFIVSRSLLSVALAHLLFNFLQFQFMRLLPEMQEWLEAFEG